MVSLIGDSALKDGAPEVHAHMVIGKRDGTAHGGHLQEARVRPTLELILTESPEALQKTHDAESAGPPTSLSSLQWNSAFLDSPETDGAAAGTMATTRLSGCAVL